MLKRKIQSKLIDYLENRSNKILVLNGARQIGKSYIIRHEVKAIANPRFPLKPVYVVDYKCFEC